MEKKLLILVVKCFMTRVFYYFSENYHYFLIDWCYFGTTYFLITINFFPKSETLLRTVFLYSNGALAIAVAHFRNSLVFHRIDYSVSLAIHAMPLLTMVKIRWYSIPYVAELPEE